MIDAVELTDLKNIIINNPNINYELKDKVIECVELIVKKYPIAYRNLYTNLQTITIRYSNETDKIRLQEIRVDSCYNCNENLLLLNEQRANGQYYRNIIIHELLHVSSYNELNMGFESLYAKKGLSFNEGMTEYLTQEILNNHSFGMATYVNDINNIMLLSTVIPLDKLINLYFTDGLLGLFNEYIKKIGNKNNLNELMRGIDKDFDMRVRKNVFDNEYKDTYIKLFIDDISKIEFNNDEEIINTIRIINSFIRSQYKTDTIPLTIKESIQNSINTIFSKSSIEKGKKNV